MISFSKYLTERDNIGGVNYEKEIKDKLVSSGHAPLDHPAFTDTGGGYSGGTDAAFVHGGEIHNLELKNSLSAVFGQLALSHHPVHGWTLSEKSKKEKPAFSAYIERSGVLQKINEEWGSPYERDRKTHDIYHDAPNGAEGVISHYAHDKDTRYIQIGGHGLYSVDGSDRAKLGVPSLDSSGFKARFRIRVKNKGKDRNGNPIMMPIIGLQPFKTQKALQKSHLSLDADIPER